MLFSVLCNALPCTEHKHIPPLSTQLSRVARTATIQIQFPLFSETISHSPRLAAPQHPILVGRLVLKVLKMNLQKEEGLGYSSSRFSKRSVTEFHWLYLSLIKWFPVSWQEIREICKLWVRKLVSECYRKICPVFFWQSCFKLFLFSQSLRMSVVFRGNCRRRECRESGLAWNRNHSRPARCRPAGKLVQLS